VNRQFWLAGAGSTGCGSSFSEKSTFRRRWGTFPPPKRALHSGWEDLFFPADTVLGRWVTCFSPKDFSHSRWEDFFFSVATHHSRCGPPPPGKRTRHNRCDDLSPEKNRFPSRCGDFFFSPLTLAQSRRSSA
jgi:hypothetical protein